MIEMLEVIFVVIVYLILKNSKESQKNNEELNKQQEKELLNDIKNKLNSVCYWDFEQPYLKLYDIREDVFDIYKLHNELYKKNEELENKRKEINTTLKQLYEEYVASSHENLTYCKKILMEVNQLKDDRNEILKKEYDNKSSFIFHFNRVYLPLIKNTFEEIKNRMDEKYFIPYNTDSTPLFFDYFKINDDYIVLCDLEKSVYIILFEEVVLLYRNNVLESVYKPKDLMIKRTDINRFFFIKDNDLDNELINNNDFSIVEDYVVDEHYDYQRLDGGPDMRYNVNKLHTIKYQSFKSNFIKIMLNDISIDFYCSNDDLSNELESSFTSYINQK